MVLNDTVSHPNKYLYISMRNKWPENKTSYMTQEKRKTAAQLFFFCSFPQFYKHFGCEPGVSTFWRFEVHSGARTCCWSGRCSTSVEKQRAEASSKLYEGVGRMGGCLVVEDVKWIKRKTPKTWGKKKYQRHGHYMINKSV